MGPLSISEMLIKSEVDLKDIDNDVEIKQIEKDGRLNVIGMFKKGTTKSHGICRRIHKNGVLE